MSFKPGDVIWIEFPFKEDVLQNKRRPALVLECNGPGIYTLAQITSKNRTHQLDGIWVTRHSVTWVKMGLLTDSFINLSNVKQISLFHAELAGECDLMEDIKRILESKKSK